eukprot:scaffold115390_cov56-Phaeocystis_antarctica.AAC.2
MPGVPVARSLPGSTELPGAARHALRRRRVRAGALPSRHFDHAAVQRSRGAGGGRREAWRRRPWHSWARLSERTLVRTRAQAWQSATTPASAASA